MKFLLSTEADAEQIDRLEKKVAELETHQAETDALVDRLIALAEKQEANR